MFRKFTVLGAVYIGMLIACGAGAAAAAAGEYHSAGAPATITGSQNGTNALHFPGAGTWECTTAVFHSSQSATTTKDLTVHPEYAGCKAFGFANTHVITTGCDYTLTEPTGASSPYSTKVHIVCSEGKSIKITPTAFGASVCTMTIGSQEVGGMADLRTESGKVRLTSTLTGLNHSSGCGAEAASDAVYTGEILFQGSAGEISVSGGGGGASGAVEYHSATGPTISGSQVGTNAFHVPGAGTVECTTATFHNVPSATTVEELTIHPTYSGCRAFGFAITDVTTANCDYTFTKPAGGPTTFTAAVHIACSAGNSIKVTPTVFGGSVCTIVVASQSPGGSVDLENEAGKVLATSTVTGISHSAGCGASAAADGVYTGSVLAQGGAGAISVSAGTYHNTGAAQATVTGSQTGATKNILTVPSAGSVECTTATFHGSQPNGTSTDLTIHPAYSGCSAFGFASAHVTTTGCDYTLTTPTEAGGKTHAKVDIACSAGNSIKITPTSAGVSACTVTIGSQEAAGVADLANSVPRDTITINWTLTGIKHSAGCGAAEASDATYTKEAILEESVGAIWALGGEYHRGSTISGSQTGATKNIFTVPSAGAVECSDATFHGEQAAGTSTDLTIHPTYSNCSAFGYGTAHVTTTGCDYTLTTPTGSGPFSAKVDIVCSAGNSIKITPTSAGVSACTMTIGSQEAGGVADLVNSIPKDTITIKWTLTGIKHSAGCEASEASDATYTKEVSVVGSVGAIWVE